MAELANRAINCATQDEVKELVHHISNNIKIPETTYDVSGIFMYYSWISNILLIFLNLHDT